MNSEAEWYDDDRMLQQTETASFAKLLRAVEPRGLTAQEIATLTGVRHQTARNRARKLVSSGFFVETTPFMFVSGKGRTPVVYMLTDKAIHVLSRIAHKEAGFPPDKTVG